MEKVVEKHPSGGFVVEPMSLAVILGAAEAFYKNNKHREPDMALEELIGFQILSSILKQAREAINE